MEKTITIDGVTYKPTSAAQGPWTLFIVDNGWILVGKADPENTYVIHEPWCVRSYGAGDGIASFITKRDEIVFEKWPSDQVTIDKGRRVMYSALPETFRAPT
jgi:hypothetical protein